jgi:TolB-like protein
MRRGYAVLVVLPFQTPGGAGDEDVLAQGLVEDITGELSRFSTLQVMARSAGLAVAGLSDAEISARLGDSHVLRGSLRRAGARLRIAVELVECAGGTQPWSERFDVPAEDLFAVQDDVVARIAATLNVRLEQALLHEARRRPADMTA